MPIYNHRDTIRQREGADELLKAIKDSSYDVNNAYEKLKAGYQRLWTLGAMKGFDALRVRLFRLILCSFAPLVIGDLIHSLRIRMDSDKLDEGLSNEDVEGLYSNFLVKDTENYLGFTHSSAREFVMREILGEPSGSQKQTAASVMWAECHALVARTCIKYISSQDSAAYEKTMRSDTFLKYFHRFWGLHCAQLSKEDRQRLGVSKELLNWIFEGSSSTTFQDWRHTVREFWVFSSKAQRIRDMSSPIFAACLWNLVEVIEKLLSGDEDQMYDLHLSPDSAELYLKDVFGLAPLSWAARGSYEKRR